jgi:hypothetical protein
MLTKRLEAWCRYLRYQRLDQTSPSYNQKLKEYSPTWRTGMYSIPISQNHQAILKELLNRQLIPRSWSIIVGLVIVVLASIAAWFFSPKGETQTYDPFSSLPIIDALYRILVLLRNS